MTRTLGAKYTGWQPAAQIAKLIRADIKQAINAGILPGTARNYRVRSDSYAGGQSIEVLAVGLPDMWQECTGIIPGSEDGFSARACPRHWCAGHYEMRDHPAAEHHQTLTVAARRISDVLEGIHGAYNHDGSDVMTDYFDVLYYGTVNIDRER
jgi:hypothetical protein